MFRRTTTKERNPQQYGEVRQEKPVSQQGSPYDPQMSREGPVSAPPRGDGQPVREAERVTTGEPMMEERPLGLGRYLANLFTLLVGTAAFVGEVVLGLRLLFKLISADGGNGFVKLIYHITGQMIRPFEGVWSVHTITHGGIFEPATVIALVLFPIAAILAIWIVRSLATLFSWGRRMALPY